MSGSLVASPPTIVGGFCKIIVDLDVLIGHCDVTQKGKTSQDVIHKRTSYTTRTSNIQDIIIQSLAGSHVYVYVHIHTYTKICKLLQPRD